MLCIHVAGDELAALTHDFHQNRFASPSMDGTSISSTMRLRVSPTWRASLQRDLSSAAHGPTSRPCKDHLCSSDNSVIVSFSNALPRSLARNRRPQSTCTIGHNPPTGFVTVEEPKNI